MLNPKISFSGQRAPIYGAIGGGPCVAPLPHPPRLPARPHDRTASPPSPPSMPARQPHRRHDLRPINRQIAQNPHLRGAQSTPSAPHPPCFSYLFVYLPSCLSVSSHFYTKICAWFLRIIAQPLIISLLSFRWYKYRYKTPHTPSSGRRYVPSWRTWRLPLEDVTSFRGGRDVYT